MSSIARKVTVEGTKLPIASQAPILPGFCIPPFTSFEVTYVGDTNNIDTITYKSGTATVATLTLAYVSAGAADDDLIASVTLS